MKNVLDDCITGKKQKIKLLSWKYIATKLSLTISGILRFIDLNAKDPKINLIWSNFSPLASPPLYSTFIGFWILGEGRDKGDLELPSPGSTIPSSFYPISLK